MVRRIVTVGLFFILLMVSACGQLTEKQFVSGTNRVLPEKLVSSGTTVQTGLRTIEPTETTEITATTETAFETVPVATAQPKPESSEGIVVKSDNILSSAEKEALLAELEKELDSLFGAMNEAPEVQESIDAEEVLR